LLQLIPSSSWKWGWN